MSLILTYFLGLFTATAALLCASVLGYAAALMHTSRLPVRRLEGERTVRLMTPIIAVSYIVSMILFGLLLP